MKRALSRQLSSPCLTHLNMHPVGHVLVNEEIDDIFKLLSSRLAEDRSKKSEAGRDQKNSLKTKHLTLKTILTVDLGKAVSI